MIDAPAIAQLIDPPSLVEPVRRRRDRDRDDSRGSYAAPAIALGAVVILTDDNGQPAPCRVVYIDPTTGQAYCEFIPEQMPEE